MASPQQIEDFIDKQTDFAKRNQREITRRLDQQRAQEARIVEETQSFCPVDQLKDRTVRAEDIERALKDGYGDANILKALLCLNNAVVATPPLSAVRGFGRNFKVRQYIQNLKQIGGESAYGYAMLADIKGRQKDGKGLFVVKSPQKTDRDLRAEQIHEYFCGAFGTNQLRDRIPNFSSVLGFFQCSPPYIDEKKYLDSSSPRSGNNGQGSSASKDRVGLTYCQNNSPENEVNYIFYENVANSVTFGDFITKGASFQDYLSILVQVTLALDLAYIERDYTHYDLHHENVLVRTLDQEIYIPYVVDKEGNQSYLKTRHVATIIDYGRCHIKYEGQHYGYSFPEYGILPDRSYPMYDLYKLLMFSLSAALFKKDKLDEYAELSDEELAKRNLIQNPDVYNNAKELILYFYPDLPREEVRRQLTIRSVRPQARQGPADSREEVVEVKVEASKYTVESLDYYYTLPYVKELDIRPLDFFENALMAAFPKQVESLFSQDEPADINLVYGCANRGFCKTLQQALSDYSVDDESLIRDPYMFFESVSEGLEQRDLSEVIRLGRPYVKEYFDQLNQDKDDYYREYQQLSSGVSGRPGRPGNLSVLSLKNANLADRTFLESYRAYVAKAVKIVDLMTSLKSIESVMKKIIEVYPDESSPYRSLVNELSRIIQREKPIVDRIVNSIKIDVGYLNQLKEKDVVARNPSARWLFQKMPTLTAAIVRI
jgi:hypothetical protein